MRKIKWAIPIAALALLSTSALLNAKQAKGDDTERPEQVQKLLSKVKVEALQLKDDLENLQSLTSMVISWESHASVLNQVRDDINLIGRDLQKLNESRDDATLWERVAIDQIRPALADLAVTTQGIIDRVNKNPKMIGMPEYKDYVEANADAAADLARMIGDYIDYGRSKQRVDRLSQRREIPENLPY